MGGWKWRFGRGARGGMRRNVCSWLLAAELVLHVRLPTRVASRDWWATSPASVQAAILLVSGLYDLLDWE